MFFLFQLLTFNSNEEKSIKSNLLLILINIHYIFFILLIF
jgi:hypothetical protein